MASPTHVVIVHGWSDTSKSFLPLARFLKANGFEPVPLWLGDYRSMDDDVRIQDVGKRMERAVREKMKSGELKEPFDLIVHSTGGLVAREWISSHFADAPGLCPVRRLLMLAPANFGSPLAAKGQSALGRIVKGWDNWFHTGVEMLRSLELASPYQWDLANRDLFVPEGAKTAPAFYGQGGVWPFIITGTHPYPKLLRRIVNENGGDGTVRVPAANLNARGATLDFSEDEEKPTITPWAARNPGKFPFAVLPDRTHASIIDPGKPDVKTPQVAQDRLGDLILGALQCEDPAAYQAMAQEWQGISEQTAELASDETKREGLFGKGWEGHPEYFHQYIQVIVRVVDDHGADVQDYFLEFSGPEGDKKDEATVYFHREVLEDVHPHSRNRAFRCLYADRTDLINEFYKRIGSGAKRELHMSVSATPPGKNVSYFGNYKKGAKGSLPVHMEADQDKRWLKRNTTHLVKIVIPRTPSPKVFALRRAEV